MLLKALNKRFQQTDWIGLWYELLKERGENDLIAMVRSQRLANGEVKDLEKYSFSHSQMDGTSAIPYYFSQFGEDICPREVKQVKRPGLLKTIKLTWENRKLTPKNIPIWKSQNQDSQLRRIEDIFLYSRLSLDAETTLKIKNYCRDNKISENSLLLYHFNQEVIQLIDNPQDDLNWLFPVNMRGIITKKDSYQNHSSFIPLITSNKVSLIDINNQMRQGLKSFRYIGIWWIHHIGILLGKNGMRKLSLKSSQKSFWLGTFSNVGEWTTSPDQFKSLCENQDEAWFFAVPGSRNFPIGLVIMTMNGQMNFSLRIHPSLGLCHEREKTLLASFINRLKQVTQ